jgi:hypothetical protein
LIGEKVVIGEKVLIGEKVVMVRRSWLVRRSRLLAYKGAIYSHLLQPPWAITRSPTLPPPMLEYCIWAPILRSGALILPFPRIDGAQEQQVATTLLNHRPPRSIDPSFELLWIMLRWISIRYFASSIPHCSPSSTHRLIKFVK